MDENQEINVFEFIDYVSLLNSGGDRDCVFAYLEDFLKEEKGIEVDLEKFIGEMYGK